MDLYYQSPVIPKYDNLPPKDADFNPPAPPPISFSKVFDVHLDAKWRLHYTIETKNFKV